MDDRRTFLRSLAALPLIGGQITLIGQPTASAVPVTDTLLADYEMWLDLEKSWLGWERYGSIDHRERRAAEIAVVFYNRRTEEIFDGANIYDPKQRFTHNDPMPSTRAAVVLSAAGVPLTGAAYERA